MNRLALAAALLGIAVMFASAAFSITPEEATMIANAAGRGDDGAQLLLAVMEGQLFHLEEGLYQRAPDLHKLAEDGDTEAQYQLAMRYENGAFGEQQDNEKALYWFRLAAANGHVMGMKSLAHIFKNGLIGTAIDLQQAQYWSEKARESAK